MATVVAEREAVREVRPEPATPTPEATPEQLRLDIEKLVPRVEWDWT
jgi:hypothetical protein